MLTRREMMKSMGIGSAMFAAGVFGAVAQAAGARDAAHESAGVNGVTVKKLFDYPLEELPGHNAVVMRVDLAPGASSPPHHHPGSVIGYVLAGAVVVLIGTATDFTPLQAYPVDTISTLVNALLVSYAVTRYRLVDTGTVLRRGLSIMGIVVIGIVGYGHIGAEGARRGASAGFVGRRGWGGGRGIGDGPPGVPDPRAGAGALGPAPVALGDEPRPCRPPRAGQRALDPEVALRGRGAAPGRLGGPLNKSIAGFSCRLIVI